MFFINTAFFPEISRLTENKNFNEKSKYAEVTLLSLIFARLNIRDIAI